MGTGRHVTSVEWPKYKLREGKEEGQSGRKRKEERQGWDGEGGEAFTPPRR